MKFLNENVGKRHRNELTSHLENLGDGALIDTVLRMGGLADTLAGYKWKSNDYFFFNGYFDRPYDVVQAVSNGDYNIGHEFVKFDGYGDLVSADGAEVARELRDITDVIADACIELYEGGRSFYLPDSIVEILENNVQEIDDSEYDLIED